MRVVEETRYTGYGKQLTSPIGTSPEFLKRASVDELSVVTRFNSPRFAV